MQKQVIFFFFTDKLAMNPNLRKNFWRAGESMIEGKLISGVCVWGGGARQG